MSFETAFRTWLAKSLAAPVPPQVVAFSFNLYEPAGIEGVKFGLELIGAEKFDPTDSDWACEEVWEPEQRRLAIPSSFSGVRWEECLERVRSLVDTVLMGDGQDGRVLKSRVGVGLGFVDGDLHVLWQRG